MSDFYYTESHRVKDENHRENTLCGSLCKNAIFLCVMLKISHFFRDGLQQTFDIAVTKRKSL